MVIAGLAADAFFGAAVQRTIDSTRRCSRARGIAAARALDAGALPASRRHLGMGHARHCGVPERSSPQGRPLSAASQTAGALPFDLRRNAFGIQRAAFRVADESQE